MDQPIEPDPLAFAIKVSDLFKPVQKRAVVEHVTGPLSGVQQILGVFDGLPPTLSFTDGVTATLVKVTDRAAYYKEKHGTQGSI